MNDQVHGVRMSWPLMVAGALGLVLLGAGGAGLLLRGSGDTHSADATRSAPAAPEMPQPVETSIAPRDATVTLTPELMRRAGIEVARVEVASSEGRLRLPGTVQPNEYRSISVTPLVSGRITEVAAELGDQVSRGQTIARVYSPELAEAQTAFLASQADLVAHDQRLRRTERLVQIGASSQQELEQVHAEHTAMTSRVASDRSRLELLGFSPDSIAKLAGAGISSVVDVPAPIAGVVTERRANLGLNVDPSMALFTVVDLSTVWVVADLFERDFALARVGRPATVTTTAYAGFRVDGRVSYIEPQVRSDTRTAKLRVEVPNPGGLLRLGMYVDVDLMEPEAPATVVIPKAAVQAVGDRYVVYVPADPSGTFVERTVQLGRRSGDVVQVASGLAPGEQVVVGGAFFLRSERERVAPAALER